MNYASLMDLNFFICVCQIASGFSMDFTHSFMQGDRSCKLQGQEAQDFLSISFVPLPRSRSKFMEPFLSKDLRNFWMHLISSRQVLIYAHVPE